MQGDLSRKEWVAPALSPLTEGAGGTGNAGAGQGFGAAISNAVEGAKGYLPPQVWPSVMNVLAHSHHCVLLL
jgi:hypothetical protein